MLECDLYDIIKTRAVMSLNALYKILLKWGSVCVWKRIICYYKNESWYVSEWTSHDIIEM